MPYHPVKPSTIDAYQTSIAKLYSWCVVGSPIGCVLVEYEAQHSGEWEQQHHRTGLDQLGVQLWVKQMEIYCSSQFTLHRDISLHEDTANGRAAAHEVTFLGVGELW